jgi:hypothetical protein
MGRLIREHKRSPTGQRWTFLCEEVGRDARRWVLRYVSERPYVVEGTLLPPGTTTLAVYWRDRPYHLWRFVSPQGEILGHRCDLTTYPRFGEDELEWMDLILDLWLPVGATRPRRLDEEEFHRWRPWLHPTWVHLAERTAAYLERHLLTLVETTFASLPPWSLLARGNEPAASKGERPRTRRHFHRHRGGGA